MFVFCCLKTINFKINFGTISVGRHFQSRSIARSLVDGMNHMLEGIFVQRFRVTNSLFQINPKKCGFLTIFLDIGNIFNLNNFFFFTQMSYIKRFYKLWTSGFKCFMNVHSLLSLKIINQMLITLKINFGTITVGRHLRLLSIA